MTPALQRWLAIIAAILGISVTVGVTMGLRPIVIREYQPHLESSTKFQESAACRFCVLDCVQDSKGERTEDECHERCRKRGQCQ